jgi:hypothetical protein
MEAAMWALIGLLVLVFAVAVLVSEGLPRMQRRRERRRGIVDGGVARSGFFWGDWGGHGGSDGGDGGGGFWGGGDFGGGGDGGGGGGGG